MLVRRISRIIFDRRAVNNTISATLLTGAVIALSLAVFGWAQTRSSNYNREIDESIDAETGKLMEKLVFEYISYNATSSNLTVYLLNCGTTDDVKIQAVFIYDSSSTLIEIFSKPLLYTFQSWDEIPGQALERGGEGRLVLPLPGLSSGFCNIKIVTARGATFDSNFLV